MGLRGIFFLLTTAIVSLSGTEVFAQPERSSGFEPTMIALTGGTVIPQPGERIENGVVLWDEGLVLRVGTSEEVAIPPSARVIDVTGHFVYPGFIDAGTSALLDPERKPEIPEERKVNFSRYVLAATRPDNRRQLTPDFMAWNALKSDSQTLDPWRKAGFTAVQVIPTGRVASGQSVLIGTGTAPLPERMLDQSVGLQFSLFAPRGSRYPSTLMGATAYLRQAFVDADRHATHRKLFDRGTPGVKRPKLDPQLDLLSEAKRRQHPAIFRARSKDDMHRALDFAEEHGLRVTLWDASAVEKTFDRIVDTKTPLILRMPSLTAPGMKPWKEEPLADDQPEPLRVQRAERSEWEDGLRVVDKLTEAGVPVMLSSEGQKTPEDLRTFLRVAAPYGLGADQALATLTTTPAKWLGQERRLGKLQPGMLANVTVLTGPLLNKQAKVRHVFIEGEHHEFNEKSKPLENIGDDRVALMAPRPKVSEEPGPSGLPTELEADRLAGQEATGGNLFIENITVLTGRGETLRGTSILVRDGIIRAIGPNLTPPSGVRVVDGTDRYVMPGIIDTHSHIMITDGINEATQSVTAEVNIQDCVDSEDVSEFRALAGGVTTARLLHGSANVIGGQHAIVKLKYGRTAREHLMPDVPRGIKFALGENVKRNPTRFPNTRLGVEATLNRAFMEALDYRARWWEYERAAKKSSTKMLPPRRDLRLEALRDILDEELFIHSHCYRADEILMLMRVAESVGVRVRSLQHVLEGYKVAPEIVKHGASCSTFADWWAYKIEAYDATPFNAALLQEAGANTVIKSDDWELIRHLYHEAAKPMRYGNVTADEALAMVTFNPARELGIDARVGSIEVGKEADLAIFNGHPLATYSRCQMTIIEGNIYYDRERLPTAMSEAARKRTRVQGDLPLAPPPVRSRQLNLSASPNGHYAITNAKLYPVSSEPIERGTIVIKNGTIVAVGTDVEVPAEAQVIDGTGLVVTPGLIDAGTTLGLTEIGQVSATHDYRESGDFHPDLRAGVAINPDSELIPVARSGGITLIHIRPTGSMLAGQTSTAKLAGWTAPEMVLNLEQGLQFNWPLSDTEKRLKSLKEFFGEARLYLKTKAKAKTEGGTAPIPDPRYDALAPYLDGSQPVFIEADSRKAIAAALKFAEEEKIRPIITGGTDAWKLAEELKNRNVPVIVGPVMRSPISSYDPQDAPYANPGRLHEAGVPFCIRSDDASNSRNAPLEAAMAVSHGLPEEAALRSVTLSAAEILGLGKEYGSLEVGKKASLVISDGLPLRIASQTKGVFVDGQPFAPGSRQIRLYERYRSRLQTSASR